MASALWVCAVPVSHDRQITPLHQRLSRSFEDGKIAVAVSYAKLVVKLMDSLLMAEKGIVETNKELNTQKMGASLVHKTDTFRDMDKDFKPSSDFLMLHTNVFQSGPEFLYH
ncbi:unnamed protein product [Sphenostylis stenocarpa]|uniref:Uncharacterized protein n=1 Tax=Sphenostylis stenocarpa TaxID=92480 RepID=A0AA86VI22_9FABA|nr:unnamed protein product [Sphenostylis stenocarpa]